MTNGGRHRHGGQSKPPKPKEPKAETKPKERPKSNSR